MIILDLLVGLIGSRREIGFWQAFVFSLVLSPLFGLLITLSTEKTEDEVSEEKVSADEPNRQKVLKKLSATLIVLLLIAFGAGLPFHYALEYGMVFPKEHLSFSNTFVTSKDVDKLIKRYNNASLFEQHAIRQEPLARKLFEKGIIIDLDEQNN